MVIVTLICLLFRDFITLDKQWDVSKLSDTVNNDIVNQIVNILLPHNDIPDTLLWGLYVDGNFSTKTPTWLAQGLFDRNIDKCEFYWIWKLNVPPKLNFFLWKTCVDGVPTKSRLLRNHIIVPPQCVLCNRPIEDKNHFFFKCSLIALVIQDMNIITFNNVLAIYDNIASQSFIGKLNHLKSLIQKPISLRLVGERESLWMNLRNIARQVHGPWAIWGDFNCVLQGNERLGGQVSDAETVPFYDCLQECCLMDIPATRAFYTWNNKKPPETRECVSNVWEKWVDGTKMFRVVRKLKMLKPELKKINKDHFSDIENNADIMLTQIQEKLIANLGDEVLMKQEYDAHQVSISLLAAKMEFLKQKAKAHWIKDGDSNTAYFHGVIKARRLAKILPGLIAQNQGGFIQGRGIMENILIFKDIIRLYERQAVSPRCLFKMDLQKAYDTIEWEFLDQMLSALNFPVQFKGWIMQYVTTATYSLNLKGNVFGFFKGRRGLRQGDPLFPLLFTVCMEYLSRVLAHTTDNADFGYHSLCKPMKLTHLMFADDLLLFCKGDVPSIITILRTFATFSKSSGLNMIKGKSNAYFNGIKDSLKREILQISGMVEGAMPFKYLGVPIKTTRLNAKDYKPLIDKIMKRIRNLGARKLSYAGRLTLVQAVLKTLHNYWASIFIQPTGVITRIESTCRNFLWDRGLDYMRAPLVSWEKVCKPKKEGGLGLKDDIQ
ncbi:uncharacterized protein LOC141595528 [Silene latifolia]|uniref:uncharacterized protein LOC141595528 n=1 Tax=Silene latifolia TaxID=37657 RepID=UPI003D789812